MRYAPCPDSDFPAKELTPAEVEDAMEMSEEYRQRQIEEGITDYELSADDADWDSYAQSIRAALGKTVGDEILR
jgi:hypothetical protein